MDTSELYFRNDYLFECIFLCLEEKRQSIILLLILPNTNCDKDFYSVALKLLEHANLERSIINVG